LANVKLERQLLNFAKPVSTIPAQFLFNAKDCGFTAQTIVIYSKGFMRLKEYKALLVTVATGRLSQN